MDITTAPVEPGTSGSVPHSAACGSAAVMRDAWAVFDRATGSWVLGPIFDAGFCDTCGRETRFQWISQEEHRRRQIRTLNDNLRQGQLGPQDRIVITCGVKALGLEAINAIVAAVAKLTAFTPENDPHQERDVGALEHAGQRIFFKIDYYDPKLAGGSADPTDPGRTARVLTIMLASEY